MLGADDLTQMQNDLLAVRDDNAVSIVIRRGNSVLAAQSVRVARVGGGASRQGDAGGQEVRARVIVVGTTMLDIQVDDRFTTNGILYRVTFVRPNRLAATTAEAEAVE